MRKKIALLVAALALAAAGAVAAVLLLRDPPSGKLDTVLAGVTVVAPATTVDPEPSPPPPVPIQPPPRPSSLHLQGPPPELRRRLPLREHVRRQDGRGGRGYREDPLDLGDRRAQALDARDRRAVPHRQLDRRHGDRARL